MEDVLVAVEEYGLPLILLLGAIYALYRFMVFSLYEVNINRITGIAKIKSP